jgi:hypothetical protein
MGGGEVCFGSGFKYGPYLTLGYQQLCANW